uniref:Uncharacterized protein n=1 Tax=Zea mays TaxID=4577 RepID=B4FF12_MAIZE|nr:unknown [Zea mays]
MPWLVLWASQRCGVAASTKSWLSPIGLVSGSCHVSPSQQGQSMGCITSGAAWSVVSLEGQPVGSFGLLLPPAPPLVGGIRHGVAGVVGSWVLPPIQHK